MRKRRKQQHATTDTNGRNSGIHSGAGRLRRGAVRDDYGFDGWRIHLLHDRWKHAEHGFRALFCANLCFNHHDNQSHCRGFGLFEQRGGFGHVHHQPARRGNSGILARPRRLYFNAVRNAFGFDGWRIHLLHDGRKHADNGIHSILDADFGFSHYDN